MRRILLSCVCAVVLMLPAAASAGASVHQAKAKPGYLVLRKALDDGGVNGRPVVTVVVHGFVRFVAVCLAAAGLDKAVVLWDAANPKPETTVSLAGHADPVRTVAYLRDGILASVSMSGHMILWDTRAAVPVAEFHLSDRLATSVAISPDGRRVATGSSDGKLSLYETVKVTAGDVEFDARVRIDTPGEANYYRNGGIMQYVLRSLRGSAPA